jgi:hypothetical protein
MKKILIILGLTFSLFAETSFNQAIAELDEGNTEKGVRMLIELADNGDAKAQINLGVMFYDGDELNQDKIKAYHYFLLAAKQGNLTAQDNLDILCKESPWACQGE